MTFNAALGIAGWVFIAVLFAYCILGFVYLFATRRPRRASPRAWRAPTAHAKG